MFHSPKPSLADEKNHIAIDAKELKYLDQLERIIEQPFDLEQPLYVNRDGKLICQLKNQKTLVGFPEIYQFLRLKNVEIPNFLMRAWFQIEKNYKLHIKWEKDIEVLKELLNEANKKKDEVDIKKIIELFKKLGVMDLEDIGVKAIDAGEYIKILSAWSDVLSHPELKNLMHSFHLHCLLMKIMKKIHREVVIPKDIAEVKNISDLEALYRKITLETLIELSELRNLFLELEGFYMEPGDHNNVSAEKSQEWLEKIKMFGLDQLKLNLGMEQKQSGRVEQARYQSIFDLVFDTQVNLAHRDKYPHPDEEYSDLILSENIKEAINECKPGSLPVLVKENLFVEENMQNFEQEARDHYIYLISNLLQHLKECFHKRSQQEMQPWIQTLWSAMSIVSPDFLLSHNYLNRIIMVGDPTLLKDFLNNKITPEIDLNEVYKKENTHKESHPLFCAINTTFDDATKREIIKILINAGISPKSLDMETLHVTKTWQTFMNDAHAEYLKGYKEALNDKLKIGHLSSIVGNLSGTFGSADSKESSKDKKIERPKP